ERVRLDQLGARPDVADVNREHALRRAHIRLLGAAQARDRGGDEGSHAAVGDDRRSGAEALFETVHRGSVVKRIGQARRGDGSTGVSDPCSAPDTSWRRCGGRRRSVSPSMSATSGERRPPPPPPPPPPPRPPSIPSPPS